MRHPPHTCPPPKPPCPDGVLLPRIIAHEKRSIQRLCTELRLDPCADPCLKLRSLHAAAAQPEWHVMEDPCALPKLRLSIPVCAKLCDACGACRSASGVIHVETPLPRSFDGLCQHTLFVQSQVRLLCAESCCEAGLFQVQIALSLDLYLLSLQPCLMHPHKPACPQLPLYPPPMQ